MLNFVPFSSSVLLSVISCNLINNSVTME